MKMKMKLRQIVLLLCGLSVAHLGVTLFIQSNLGSDPFNVLIQGIFRSVPWPEGLAWKNPHANFLSNYPCASVCRQKIHQNWYVALYVSWRTDY